jgi:hypothetical protein
MSLPQRISLLSIKCGVESFLETDYANGMLVVIFVLWPAQMHYYLNRGMTAL